jgi:CubicO group peptidase (beta-lactamase class C family)
MRPHPFWAVTVVVAGATLSCGGAPAVSDAGAEGAAAAADPVESVGPPTYLTLTGPAKRFCSGLWVSERVAEEALYSSVLHSEEQVRDYERGRLAFDVDRERRIVTASKDGVEARARHFGDQGCVILPHHSDGVFFTPREVRSTLPDAASTPWPMGDVLPEGPLPDDVDAETLAEAVRTFFTDGDNRAAFLVVHRGRIVAEEYGSGAHRDMQLESWSMGKSLTATLVGRLIQMDHLELWQPAPVPAWQNSDGDPRSAIRIADLLRMSSGLRFSNTDATPEQMARSFVPGQVDHRLGYVAPIDAFAFSVSRDAEFPPNTVGRYRNSDPWTLGYVVRRTVENELGEEYLTWPQRALFDEIGIRRFTLETDPYGNFLLTGYNFGTARNWARLGLLYLQRGVWNGTRLLSEEFVDFVRTPAPAWDRPFYGGLFWLNTADESGRGGRIPSLPPDAYNAAGAGDQATYIIPSRDLVIVVQSHRSPAAHAPDRRAREREALGLAVKAVDPTWSW